MGVGLRRFGFAGVAMRAMSGRLAFMTVVVSSGQPVCPVDKFVLASAQKTFVTMSSYPRSSLRQYITIPS